MSDRDIEASLQLINEGKVDEARKFIEQKIESPNISDEERFMLYMHIIPMYSLRGNHKSAVACVHRAYGLVKEIRGEINIYFEALIAMGSDTQGAELLSELFDKISRFLLQMIFSLDDGKEREVFHYTSENVKGSIQSEGFRLCNVKNLNDDLEGNVFLDRLSLEQQQKDELKRIFGEYNYSYIYSGSFTFDGESDYMWNQYGKRKTPSERGIMLCWNRDDFTRDISNASIFARNPGILGLLRENFIFKEEMFLFPVVYENQFSKNLIFQKMLEEISEVIKKILVRSHQLKDQNQNNDSETILFWAKMILDCFRFLFKSDDYKDEKERRVFVFRLPNAKCIVKSDEDNEPLYVKIDPKEFIPNRVITDPNK